MFKQNNKVNSVEIMKSANKETTIPSIVNKDTSIIGDVSCDNILEIFGNVKGSIKSKVFSLREEGVLEGDITAQYVKISGTFKGDVTASIIHISATANVSGNLNYGIIAIEEKAIVEGKMKQDAKLLDVKDIMEKNPKVIIEEKINKIEDAK